MNNLRRPGQRENEVLDCAVVLAYKMCPVRKSQERKDFVNLLILILEDASNRKFYTWANLQVLSCRGFVKSFKNVT